MTRRVLAIVLLVGTFAGSLAVPAFVAGGAVAAALSAFRVGAAAAIGVALMLSWLAKAAKYLLLARRLRQPIGFGDCLLVSLGCDFAFIATPGGLGGYPATIYLGRRASMAPACSAAIAGADQVLDLLFFAAAVPLAALSMLAGHVDAMPGVDVRPVLLITVVAVLSTVLLRRTARKRLIAVARWPLPAKCREWLAAQWRQVGARLEDLRRGSPQFIAGLFAATALQWIARYAVLALAASAAGWPVPFAAVLLIQALALHAGQWTGVPGGIGGADLIVAEALKPWAPVEATAGILVIWRLATFHLSLCIGALAFAVLAARRRRTAFENAPLDVGVALAGPQ